MWTTNDYEMAPHNAAATNRPFTTARLKPGGVNTFPVGRRTVKITGYWGWPATPAQIIEACYLQCERLYQRRNSPMGVAGPNEFGQLTALAPLDPDVIMLLRPYMRLSMRGCMIVRIVGLEQPSNTWTLRMSSSRYGGFHAGRNLYSGPRTDQRSGVSGQLRNAIVYEVRPRAASVGVLRGAFSTPLGRRRSGWSTARGAIRCAGRGTRDASAHGGRA